jgi:hypothetical protein
MSAGLIGLVAFIAVAVVGALVYFLVLKKDPVQCVPTATKSCQAGPTTAGPTTLPPTTIPPTTPPTTIPPTTPPTTIPPTTPPPDGGGKVNLSFNVCDSVDANLDCVGPGLTKPAGKEFVVYTFAEGTSAGDTFEIQYVNPDTGQAMGEPNSWTVEKAGNVVFTVKFGPQNPLKVEFLLFYNGNPVDFGKPLVLTVQ